DLPQPRLLVVRSGVRPDTNALAAHLDLRVGVRAQVHVPVRVSRRATHRRDDEVVVAVAAEDQGRGALLAGLPSGRREKEGRHAVPEVADLAVRLAVAAYVLLAAEAQIGRAPRAVAHVPFYPQRTGIAVAPRSYMPTKRGASASGSRRRFGNRSRSA